MQLVTGGPVRGYGPMTIDTRDRQVRVHGIPVPLSPKEHELLVLLAEDPGAVVTRRRILDEVWGPEFQGPSKTLDFHVARLRRAVLAAAARYGSTPPEVEHMRELAGLSERVRLALIDDFLGRTFAGLDGFAGIARPLTPELPEDPAPAQLEAWIELAELVRDTAVRQAVRRELYQVCTTGAGPLMTSSPMLDTLEAATPIGQAAMDAARERLPPDSPRGREVADRWIGWLSGIFATPDSPGRPDTPEFRLQAADHMLQAAEWERTPPDPRGPFDRYMALVTAVNNVPPEPFPFEWLAAALRASATPAS